MIKDVVSIIIPVYNSEKYILETINSILNQDYPFFELILVDDGSSDDSFLIIEEYVKNDIRIKYFKKNNSGAAETRNYGLKYATGDYIFFLDSDDLIEKDTLAFDHGLQKCNTRIAVPGDLTHGQNIISASNFNAEPRLVIHRFLDDKIINRQLQDFAFTDEPFFHICAKLLSVISAVHCLSQPS